jgi:hypothetical protein
VNGISRIRSKTTNQTTCMLCHSCLLYLVLAIENCFLQDHYGAFRQNIRCEQTFIRKNVKFSLPKQLGYFLQPFLHSRVCVGLLNFVQRTAI